MSLLNIRLTRGAEIRLFASPASRTEEPPFRRELLSLEALHRHARQLAERHKVGASPGANRLLSRLDDNEAILREYNEQTLRAERKRRITPASEWLLDNFHLLEEQIRTARRHLPRSFNRELPHLREGPRAGFPRVYDMALELIAPVDGRIDGAHLGAFLAGYQEVTHLKLGELWAIPIMLRLALIENLRRVAVLLTTARLDRNDADAWADRLAEAAEPPGNRLIVVLGEMAQAHPNLSREFVAEFWRRTQEKMPVLRLAVNWIEEQLASDGRTIDQLVRSESQVQASMQVSVGNTIGSLRFLDAMDWREFVETHSVVEQTLRTDPASVYPRMDFATRDYYRHTVERIARFSPENELTVAQRTIELAREAGRLRDPRRTHVGYFLAGKGVETLERAVGMRVPWTTRCTRLGRRWPLACYVGAILAGTVAGALPLFFWLRELAPPTWMAVTTLLLTALCTSHLAVAVVNWFATLAVRPTPLPRLDFAGGIPSSHATLVVVPTMLTHLRAIEQLLESLEVRYLANRDPNVYFALLTDLRDAPQEHQPGDDELVRQARAGVEALNAKYAADRPSVFFLFHRPRRWNERERLWMGYERKRGKLSDLNRCLRGGGTDCFSTVAGDVGRLPAVKYVITLDTDTQLPRDAAWQLAATMAHPLNEPVYDTRRGVIVEGYSILQPRVAVSLPSAERSRFVKLFAGDPGIDPYTRAVSDVYQDVFHEGSFIGKGIYDVDAFERAVGGKFPENRILSHDLLEGSYARAALVSDVQLFEDFPSRYSADTRRRHRWIRGDWQIATWLLPRLPGTDVRRVNNPLSGLSRWKIFDNLRRSLVPPGLLLLLAFGWIVLPELALEWAGFVLALVALPSLLAVATDLARGSKEQLWRSHLKHVCRSAGKYFGQGLLTLAFLPYDAFVSADAVGRTLIRLCFTRRRLLEWQTSSEAEQLDDGSWGGFLRTMWAAPAAALLLGGTLYALQSPSFFAALPLLALWMLAPTAAWWISRPLGEARPKLSSEQTRELGRLARRTWHFFETFVGPEDHWLPPDNFQQNPKPVVAPRTSPTNIGLALLGTLSAHDFGYASTTGMIERLGHTFDTLDRLERYPGGHFFNWYDTRSLATLHPQYVSTVDNGNLAGLLLTLSAGLLEVADTPFAPAQLGSGLRDTLGVLQETTRDHGSSRRLETLEGLLERAPATLHATALWLDEIAAFASSLRDAAGGVAEFETWRGKLEHQARHHAEDLRRRCPWLERASTERHVPAEPAEWQSQWLRLQHELDVPRSLTGQARATAAWLAQLDTLRDSAPAEARETIAAELGDLRREIERGASEVRHRLAQLEELASRSDQTARMDFTLLYDRSRELFSIGYNVGQHRLDASCYDLLASEARLGSFVAIALGQVPQKHWFVLGRLLTSADGDPALISWSGSMFEYLMPMLVMPSHEHTLLDVSCHGAVSRQIEYGRQMKVPWGISESGYNLRDADANYQYRAFGVPGLGFKRGLADDIVIAPYATVMALMVDPERACENLAALRREGAGGEYGLYEAIDYTVARVPRGQTHVIIESYMAHHQGMSLLALAHVLLDRPMQRRFSGNPLFKSAELLLHERVPKETSVLYPHELEANSSRESAAASAGATLRIFTDPNAGPPEVHLLSNGRYHVMVTHSGSGSSRWHDTALTRWREDATRDCWGTFVLLRDVETGKAWSTAHQPLLQPARGYEAIFSQGRAEFRLRSQGIDSHTEISVSPEDDVEVRRITLTNHTSDARTLEITTYAEIVLNTAAADLAHPAFSNLFVQTELLAGKNAVLCSRRPRGPGEQPPWLGHILLLQGTEVGTISFETDRSRFLGRGHSLAAPAALRGPAGPLGNTSGSVLDPVIAIRRTVRIPEHGSAVLTLVSAVAKTRAGLEQLVEKYQDHAIADRSFELAWTHGLILLRHLNASEPDAQLYGRLASALFYAQPARRAATSVLSRNRRGQRNLWGFGISGDLPIVLVYSTQAENLEFVRQIVQAHSYWRMKGLTADLVILNEDDSAYRATLHDQIIGLIGAANAAQLIDKPGGIFTRRTDQVLPEDRVLLESAARIVLSDTRGPLAEQLTSRPRAEPGPTTAVVARARLTVESAAEPPPRELVFQNGLGGFTPDGREYVITLRPGAATPAPWVNVLSNPHFGTLVSESGGAYTWSENCHEFRLTPWNNDATTDVSGEAFYLRDETSGRFWSPTPLPARGLEHYVTRHGFGYSVFEHAEDGIASELQMFVPVDAPVKLASLKLHNRSDRVRRLGVFGYWEWVLGELRGKNAMHIVTEFDPTLGALFARNPYNTDFDGRTAFVSCTEPLASASGDRTEFLGRNGTPANPAALARPKLSGRTGYALDPCGALQAVLTLEPDESHEIIFVLGSGRTRAEAFGLVQRFRRLDPCHEALRGVWEFWNRTLGAVHVESPEPALNVLANGWLVYQTLACRLWARTGFYQSGGAYGFRDQLQDAMALVHAHPTALREQLLRAAAHQFREGDVQHWWHPPHDRGVRTHFSDDYLWLPYAACRYVNCLADTGVLDEIVPFLDGRPVRPEEEAYYAAPERSSETASLYEHCVRAIRNGLRFGRHGLPLIGCGDWNDGMNRIGEHGEGESVWLAFFLYDVLRQFTPIARLRGDEAFALQCETEAIALQQRIEANAWDGQWYRRAYFDNGEPLGSASNPECQIDALPQSWAVLSGAGEPTRCRTAMDAVAHRLVRRGDRLIQLFDPPFDQSSLEPGYIKGYVPGVRENGGQYTHGAIWTVMAYAHSGDINRAWELLSLINPVLHAADPSGVARYKAEPYVMAADIYSVPPHTGRGGWTWYTGSAGWMYRLIAETFLGLNLEGERLRFTPRLPAEWESFKVHYRFRTTTYHLVFENRDHTWAGTQKVVQDGQEQAEPWLQLKDDGQEHRVEVIFSAALRVRV